jgi:hypothetical protein
MSPQELIQQIEDLGGTLAIDGEMIHCELTPEAKLLVPELRKLRDEVYRALQERPPSMPSGVRLLKWEPKAAPIAINEVSVVSDPRKFIEATLRQLEAALEGKSWLAGNRTVRDLIERLEQAGVRVCIERVSGDHGKQDI